MKERKRIWKMAAANQVVISTKRLTPTNAVCRIKVKKLRMFLICFSGAGRPNKHRKGVWVLPVSSLNDRLGY